MNKKGGQHFLFSKLELHQKEVWCCGRPETGLTSTLTKTHQTHTTQNPQHRAVRGRCNCLYYIIQ
jgi:hypothetical protein